jgi:DNA-binding PadR family transcriptional regulator
MNALLAGRAALLQALRRGPAYGTELVALIQEMTGRRPSVGSLYPALGQLEADGLARSWQVVPGGRRGARSRTYYELTHPGYRRAEEDAALLRSIAARPSAIDGIPSPSRATLQRRLRQVSDLIALTEDLRRRRA